jgi:hypothetical protein
MTTFSGNETVNEIYVLTGTATGGSTTTVYTCPVGKYAKVFMQDLLANTQPATYQIGSSAQYSLSTGVNAVNGASGVMQQDFIIGAGQSVIIFAGSGGSARYGFLIREFAVP